MSKFEKARDRILLKPKDYTYTEAKYILNQLGFVEFHKGKTSGSRVKFLGRKITELSCYINLIGDVMTPGAVKSLVEYLIKMEEL